MEFSGKTILISGATGGIGGKIANLLSKEKCNLALFARREETLKEISDKICSGQTKCIYRRCDVKNKKDVKNAVEFTYKAFGRVDIAILTAGVLIPNPIETFDSDSIKKSIEINFLGNIYFIEYLLPIMKKQQTGTIAVVSTLPDKRGVPGWGAYGASKAALSWFMESLRAEAKQKYNLNIVTIKPGSVETPMIKDYHRQGAIPAEAAAKIIINGIKKEKKVIEFPFLQVLATKITNLFPVWAYDKIPVEMQKGSGYPKS
ncbi:MAG TPA: SDR family NAD(P)-dependent oxidoreductase [Thermoplasmata archaeon]|nr:SDR family NAD(P)-dependent oxidoreductase [Thermoplasmata archaeon]